MPLPTDSGGLFLVSTTMSLIARKKKEKQKTLLSCPRQICALFKEQILCAG